VSLVPDVLAWLVVVTSLGGVVLEYRDDRRLARYAGTAGWTLFGAFWLAVFPQFALEMRSPIEGVLSLLAVPACLYTGLLLYRGRESLLVLSRAVAFMGLIYLPVETIPLVRQFLIESVAAQTNAVITALGYSPEWATGPDYGYQNRFVWETAGGHELSTYIVTACTGIGSMAIFGGLIAAVSAPLTRKLGAFGMAVGIIWVLNVARNVFIAVAFGNQWFQQAFLVDLVTPTIYSDPYLTSFFVADRVISQGLSVVALVGITWLLVRVVPELLEPIEEVLYVATGSEYDLRERLDLRAVRADGGDLENRR
jgi:archaeosortase A (PGF-CTERM-specific)